MKKIFIILLLAFYGVNLSGQTNYNITESLPLNLLTSASPTAITGFAANGENFVGPYNIGFNFPFFGTTYSTFYIGSNGVLSFGSGFIGDGGNYLNQIKIPQSNTYYTTPYVAFANADLNPSLGTPTINYFVSGTSPNRILVLNFNNVKYQNSTNTDLNTVQVQIFEGTTGKIEIHNTINKSPTNGTYKTIGIQKGSNFEGYTPVGMNGSTTINLVNTALRFETCATPYPVITPANPVFCTGGTTVLSATCPAGTLSWSTGATTPSISVMPTVATSYSATCTNGCTATKSVTVQPGSPPPTPSISKTPTTNIDPGTSVVLDVNSYYCPSPSVLSWDNGLGTGLMKTVTPNITTTYTAICTANGGCVSPAGSVTVNVDRIKVVTPTPTVSCSGKTISVNFNASGTFTDPNFTVKFKKFIDTFGGCNAGITELVSQTTPSNSLSITLPGNLTPSGINGYCYSPGSGNIPITVSYYLEVSNGTEKSQKYPVQIYNVCSQLYNVSVSSTSAICVGGNSNATVSFVPDGINSGNTYTVELSDVGGTTFPSTPIIVGTVAGNTATSIPIIIPTSTAIGNYKIKVKTTDPVSSTTLTPYYGGSAAYLSVDGVPSIVPTLTKNPTTDVASGTSVTLTATCTYGTPKWNDDINASASRSVTPTITTSYLATCKSPCGSSSTSTITVNVVAPPTLTQDKYSVCPGGTTGATLTASGCVSPDVVSWYINGASSSFATGLTTLVNPTVYTTYAARCTRGGVMSGNAFISVGIGTIPAAPTGITKNPNTTVGPYTAVTLAVSAGGEPIIWENGSTVNLRVVSPTITTSYSARMVDRNSGCPSATATSTTVTVDPNLPVGITIATTTNTNVCTSTVVNFTSSGCVAPDVVKWYRSTYQLPLSQVGTGLTLAIDHTNILGYVNTPVNYYATCTRGTVVSPNSNQVDMYVLPMYNPGSISASPSGAVSANTSVTLTNNSCGSPTYPKWDNGSNLSTRTVTPSTTTTYTFRCVSGTCESTVSSITIVVNGPPVITSTINPICSTGSSTNSSTVLTVTGCSGTVTWSSVPTNAPKPSGNSGTISNTLITGNVTYTAYCAASGLTSTGFLLTFVPNNNAVITATPAAILVTGTALSLSSSSAISSQTWYSAADVLLGTGPSLSISPNPVTTSEYYIKSLINGCNYKTGIKAVPFNFTLSGTGNASLDVTFSEGNGRYLIADGGGGTPAIISPPNGYDINTFYSNGSLRTFTCGYYNTCAEAYFISRKNNIWEIWRGEAGSQNGTPNLKMYHTKFLYDTQRPPCSAVWIKDADGTEITLNSSGLCENVDNTVTSITIPTSVCAGQSMPVNFTTSQSTPSYKVELLNHFTAYSLCAGSYEDTTILNTITTTTNSTSIPILAGFNASGCLSTPDNGCLPIFRCDDYRVRITPVGSTQGVSQSFVINGVTSPTAIVSTNQSGDWNTTTTWQCGGIPTATNPVQVQSGHIVNINTDVHAKSVKLLGTGKLNYTGTVGKLILNQ